MQFIFLGGTQIVKIQEINGNSFVKKPRRELMFFEFIMFGILRKSNFKSISQYFVCWNFFSLFKEFEFECLNRVTDDCFLVKLSEDDLNNTKNLISSKNK